MKIAITKPVPRSAQLFSKGPGISSRHSLPATSKAQQSFSSSLPLVLLPLYSILRWELPRLSTYLHTRSAFWCNFGISQKMFPFPEMSLSPLHSPASGFRMRHALTNSSGENEENGWKLNLELKFWPWAHNFMPLDFLSAQKDFLTQG